MKRYETCDEAKRLEVVARKYDELQLFQYLLRNCEPLNVRYHGKAKEIADGLQPWIDALEITLRT